MRFEILSKSDYEMWDRFVDESPQGSLYSKTFYLEACGLPYKIGALLKGGNIVGGIVLAKNEIAFHSNPLFVKYLGVLTKPIQGKYVTRISVEKDVIERIVFEIKNIKNFDYSFHPEFKNWLPFYWDGYRQETKYTYRINNLKQMDVVHRNIHSKIRNEMRKALKKGITITDNINLEEFYSINRLSFERQGGNIPYSFDFLKKFHQKLIPHDGIKLFGAKDKNDRFHAVCGVVYDNKSCNFLLNGIDHNQQNSGANALLLIKTIEFASKKSEIFDFEGSMIKPIERFYRYFGGTQTPYFNIWKGNLLNNFKRAGIKIYKKLKYGK